METNESELYSAEEQEDSVYDFQTDSDAIYGDVVSETIVMVMER